jgi:hypothetical protein
MAGNMLRANPSRYNYNVILQAQVNVSNCMFKEKKKIYMEGVSGQQR